MPRQPSKPNYSRVEIEEALKESGADVRGVKVIGTATRPSVLVYIPYNSRLVETGEGKQIRVPRGLARTVRGNFVIKPREDFDQQLERINRDRETITATLKEQYQLVPSKTHNPYVNEFFQVLRLRFEPNQTPQ